MLNKEAHYTLVLNLFTTEWNGEAVSVFLILYILVFIHIYFFHLATILLRTQIQILMILILPKLFAAKLAHVSNTNFQMVVFV